MNKRYISLIIVLLITLSLPACAYDGAVLQSSGDNAWLDGVAESRGLEAGEGAGGENEPVYSGNSQEGETAVNEKGGENVTGAGGADTGAAGPGAETGGSGSGGTGSPGAETGAGPDAGNNTGLDAGADTREGSMPGRAAGTEPGYKSADDVPPPVFGFIDGHADTISSALLPHNNAGLFRNKLHVDFERLSEFNAPVQVFALWCADQYVPNAFEYTNSLIDFFESEVAKHSDIIEIALTLEDLQRNARNNKISAILSIEGGEALMGKLENVDHFYNRGVRIMSLTWNRENELGYGQATGSSKGLKPFGEEVLKRMEELGMILDVSHINEAGFRDTHDLSTRPYMASHSNSYAVTPHNRNLKNDQILSIADRGGIVGLVLYPLILSSRSSADINDYMAHIRHFIELGAGANLGLGSDFDGFGTMPGGFTDVSSYKVLAEKIAEVFDEDMSRRVMYGNFYDFFVRYFEG